MKKKPEETLELLDPQQALHSYLEALLREVPDSQVDEPESQVTIPGLEPAMLAAGGQSSRTGTIDIPETQSPAADVEAAPDAKLPAWTRAEFQSLSFKVAGVTLATPLIKLNGIVELTDTIAELPGYAPWVMGILTNRGQKVQVVDLAQIIMPEGRKVDPAPVKDRAHYVILINNGNFGLAADSLSQVLTLQPEDVRWRTGQSKRPWLAGMVIDQMCAILDIDCLIEQLGNGLKIPLDE